MADNNDVYVAIRSIIDFVFSLSSSPSVPFIPHSLLVFSANLAFV